MFTVAIIKKNKIELDRTNVDSIKELIKDYIEIRKIEHKDLMELIVDTTNLTPTDTGNTVTCFENDEKIYQICFMARSLKESDIDYVNQNINNLACVLSVTKEIICNDCVLICSTINDNNLCDPSDVSFDDICNLLYKKIIHKGIKISASGNVDEFVFSSAPIEKDQLEKYTSTELPLVNFNLILYYENTPINNTLNKTGTKLLGKNKVYGDVILVSKSSEYEYLDIDMTLFNKLSKVAEGSIWSRNIKEEENITGTKVNNLPMIMNRHRILKKRLSEYKLICNYCGKDLQPEKNNLCAGCYRIRYHDVTCQQRDWHMHKDDCLIGKKDLNKI
jgi:hypothetical protein